MGLGERLQHAWNAFLYNEKPQVYSPYHLGGGYSYRPDRSQPNPRAERTIVTAVYNRIAIDVASVKIQHVRLDQNGRYIEVIDDQLNKCLNLSANIDQTGRALIQDIAMTLCDVGVAAIVPTDTKTDPTSSSAFEVEKLRVGEVTQWFPEHVRVRLYNEKNGIKQEITLPKSMVSIVENPLYPIMNSPSSTLRRLIRKLAILDAIDEQSGSGKLDLIIQLPYVIHSEKKRQLAEQRRKDIEVQLSGSKYGIAYTEATEHITQLNRPAENNLMTQIEYLTKMLYSQLGITEEVMNGVADEKTMLNYHNRTIEPMLSAITDEMNRKFLSKTARSQGQAIAFFRDPFKLVPTNNIADIADKFTRNEILSSNEVRAIIGYKPVDDPRADELRNKNLNQNNEEASAPPMTTETDHSGLEHHGIKGQHWGIKRGPPYPLSKDKGVTHSTFWTKKLKSDVQTVVNSLLDSDYNDFYGITTKPVSDIFIKYDNQTPVGFSIVSTHRVQNGYNSDISVAVVPSYRKQGLAYSLAKSAVEASESNEKINVTYWGFEHGNVASEKLAEKLGFKFSEETDEYKMYKL